MASAVSGAGTAIRLASLAVVEALATKGALVDFAVVSAREGKAIVLELDDGSGGLLAHVMNSVLVA